ncbi:hypothetical protein NE237_029195 [Protea cynaroides]|uniref:Leucine-rich repeat-containing N-terminal plant-type domain-containing protein n=1 Tax=Protea cynaroides TaxID=273540 RepID=A0A9Q0GRD6_9MAGN|nr:hypothetical protein NE237_029195 [Protea cynaroides]
MWWWWCFLFFFQSLFKGSCFLSSPSAPQLCPHDERSALLQLKQKHHHVSLPDFHLNSWKTNSDCCFWEGITCDGTIGHVVALDLFNKSFQGSIHSNSSLFHLHHLRMLNLSWNDLNYFAPSGFGILPRKCRTLWVAFVKEM